MLLAINPYSSKLFRYSFKKVMAAKRPSSNLAAFREIFKKSKRIVVLSGAGVSAESGIPTFRGAGGFWRTYQAQDLATPEAFLVDPSLVWEFYHYRRELARTKEPNKAHRAIAEAQKRVKDEGRSLVVVTQNIDNLHQRAGAQDVIELHGSMFKTRCMKCQQITENFDSPICPALSGKGAPDPESHSAGIPDEDLPKCKNPTCKGMLRPHVVWFGENLDRSVLRAAESEFESCDLCLIVGTSSVVYPAAIFAPGVAKRNIPVAEFNIEQTPVTRDFKFYFEGPCGEILPEALAP